MAITKCDFCHLQYDKNDKEDVREHEKRHSKFYEAQKDGYVTNPYQVREEIKRKSLEIINSDCEFSEKLEPTRDLIHAYFDSSMIHAINNKYNKKHPHIDDYMAMIDLPEMIPDEIMGRLRKTVGRIEHEIPTGYTTWFPKNSQERKDLFAQSIKDNKSKNR